MPFMFWKLTLSSIDYQKKYVHVYVITISVWCTVVYCPNIYAIIYSFQFMVPSYTAALEPMFLFDRSTSFKLEVPVSVLHHIHSNLK